MVRIILEKVLRPEGRALLLSRFHQPLHRAAPSALTGLGEFLIHALTGVAIECRPFGPEVAQTSLCVNPNSHRLVRTFLKYKSIRLKLLLLDLKVPLARFKR